MPTARDIFRSRKPSLVFLDIRMPGIDGAQFMAIHEKREHAAEVIVLTSLPSGDPDVVSAMGHGAVAYLGKPLRRAKVVDTLREIGALIQ